MMMLKKSQLLFIILLIFSSQACETTKQEVSQQTKSPNLLIIQTDEHNFRTLSCYRKGLPPEQALLWGANAIVETPNIDWLADNGALCTSFYATTPVCSPSRSAMVSGKYPHQTGVPKNDLPMLDDIVTFAEILRRKGYATGYAGKWHLDGTGKPQWAPARNFGFEDNRYMFNRGHWKVLEEGADGPQVGCEDNKGAPSYCLDGVNEENYATDFLADKTIAFIREHRDDPFCFMLSLPDPHGPNSVRPPYDQQFQGIDFAVPPTALKTDSDIPSWAEPNAKPLKQEAHANYLGMVKLIDDKVGEIMETLRELELLDNTLVVFTSDHGDLLGEHGRHNKGNPLEASAKVAFLLYYPSKVSPGTQIDEALSFVDFLPTTLNLIGIPTAGREHGRDASSLFTRGEAPGNWEDIAFLRGSGTGPGWLAAVSDRYKLVYSSKDADLPWLSDLEKDPDELINFYQEPEYAEIVKSMSKQLLEYGQKYQDQRIEDPKIQGEIAAIK